MTIRIHHPSPFGRLIARLRQRCRLTQKELANRTGLGYGTVIALECRPHADPLYSTIRKLAAALNVPITDLLDALNASSDDTLLTPSKDPVQQKGEAWESPTTTASAHS